jgi:hypothetical protein
MQHAKLSPLPLGTIVPISKIFASTILHLRAEKASPNRRVYVTGRLLDLVRSPGSSRPVIVEQGYDEPFRLIQVCVTQERPLPCELTIMILGASPINPLLRRHPTHLGASGS